MDPENDLPGISTCTTCRFVEDKSNYWTAVLYFKHPNGSFLRVRPIIFFSNLSTPNLIRVQVPQMSNYNTGPGLQSGGMTVYYFQPGGTAPLVAFKKVCLPTFSDSFYLVHA